MPICVLHSKFVANLHTPDEYEEASEYYSFAAKFKHVPNNSRRWTKYGSQRNIEYSSGGPMVTHELVPNIRRWANNDSPTNDYSLGGRIGTAKRVPNIRRVDE